MITKFMYFFVYYFQNTVRNIINAIKFENDKNIKTKYNIFGILIEDL
jgi:hypothetical protein